MNVRDSVKALLATSDTENQTEPAKLSVYRFDHWHNPEDAMVMPTRTGGEGGGD